MQELIEYIVKDNHDGISKSLTAAKAQAELKDDQRTTYSWSQLVTKKHSFTDLLGRTYKDITLPQYLMWRNKRDVLVVIRGYLSSQWDREIKKQEKNLQEQGFTYEFNGKTLKASYPAEPCSEWLFGCQEPAQKGSCLCSRCKDDLESLPNIIYQQRFISSVESKAIETTILVAGEYLNHPEFAKLWKCPNIQVFIGKAGNDNLQVSNPNPYFGSTRIKAFSKKWCDNKHEALILFKKRGEWYKFWDDLKRSGIKMYVVYIQSNMRIVRQIDSANDQVDYLLQETSKHRSMSFIEKILGEHVLTNMPSDQENNDILESMSGRIADFRNRSMNFINEQLRYKTIPGKKENLSEQEIKQYLSICEPAKRSVAGLNELILLVKAVQEGDFERVQPLTQREGLDIEAPIDRDNQTLLDIARNQQKYYQREHDDHPDDAIVGKKLNDYTKICQLFENKLKAKTGKNKEEASHISASSSQFNPKP